MAKHDDEVAPVNPERGDKQGDDDESIGRETGEEAERALGAPEALIGELPEE